MTKVNALLRLVLVAVSVFWGTQAIVQAKQGQESKPGPAGRVGAPPAVSVETRVQLFATLCALDAAGFDAGASASDQSSGRFQLRQRMLALKGPAVEAVRAYYREHTLADSGATLSRFVSFALAAGPPPKFAFELRREELPPDAVALDGFNDLLAAFYQEAQLGQLWEGYRSDYERGVELYRAPVSEVIFVATNYLREIVKVGGHRAFTVYVEPLVGTKTNFRSYGDHYALVVSPSSAPSLDIIRHAYLHFLLDPLAIRYRNEAARISPLLDIAARAPLLPVEYRDDFSSFFAECLVRAVELRLRRLPPGDLASAIDRAEGAGYVLVRPIYAGLAGFEKSEPSMADYLPTLIKGIDVSGEARRLRGVTFADAASGDDSPLEAERASATRVKLPASSDPAQSDLDEGERQIAARNGSAAAAAFERVLGTRPNDIRATYGLAVASALLGQPDRARELFSKVIAAGGQNPAGTSGQPDPGSLSWSHIYLGRMYDVEGKRDLAVAEYQAALAVEGAPESARAAAKRGVEAGYQTPPRQDKPDGKS